MARPLRIEYPGALYHVTSRGNARSNIYLDDNDRELFLDTLADVIQRFNWICHAYCLMDNHYHLVIETPEPNLSQGMRQLNGVYTQRFNRRHHRVGHVFQGRYKAILVERDAYLLELLRYVVLNPVRAGMVKNAEAWVWSSYRATSGKTPSPAWLNTRWVLAQFGKQRNRCISRYVQFVNEDTAREPIWNDLNGQIYLGRANFVARIKSQLSDTTDLSEIPRGQWKRVKKSLDEYARETDDRNMAMARAYLEGGYRMKEIAQTFGVHYATVSRAVKKLENNA